MKINKFLFIIFVFFPLFSFSQVIDTNYIEPKNIDVKIFRTINNTHCNFLNTFISITDKSTLPVNMLIPATLFTVSRINKNYYDENSSVLVFLSEMTGTGITFALKNIFKRDRPFVSLKNVYYNKNNPLTDRYSFPSGHTTVSFAMATSLTLRYPDKPILITGVYLYSSIIAFGRMYLGVHYPSDVLGGMLIGSGSAALIYSLRKQIISGKNSFFNESGRQDISNNSVSTPLVLISFLSTDIINYFIGGSHNKVLKSTKFNIDLNGNTNKLLLNLDL